MQGRRKPSKNFENFRAVQRATKVDRLLLKTMAMVPPKAQNMFGGRAQRLLPTR
jgi:hypothetical protein